MSSEKSANYDKIVLFSFSLSFHVLLFTGFIHTPLRNNMEILRDGRPTKRSKLYAAIGDHASRTAGTKNVVCMEEWLEKILSWGTKTHSKQACERMRGWGSKFCCVMKQNLNFSRQKQNVMPVEVLFTVIIFPVHPKSTPNALQV